MAYGIAGASFSNPSALKAANFIDFTIVVYSGSAPDTGFVSTCKNYGVSPIFNNGNDGIAGWGGGSSSYYPGVASAGYMAAGGESEVNAEDQAIMASLIFMNYGGAGTGGNAGGNNDIFNGFAHCTGATGKGMASYLESYTDSSMISAADMGTAAGICKDHGCKETGIMIGTWAGSDYGAGVSTYESMVDAYSSHGVTCGGFVVWNGHGTDANSNYSECASIISGLQAAYPPDMTTIDKRFGGVGPTPGPTPPSPQPGPTDATELAAFNEVDISDYLTKGHNGQVTVGRHTIAVYLQSGSGSVNMTAKPRLHQPGNE